MINNWGSISVEQFNEIHNLQYQNVEDYYLELISILCDISIDEVEEFDIKEFEELLSISTFINKPPIVKSNDVIYFGDEKLYKLDLNTLTVGAFIDLENLITDNLNENFSVILSILYRVKIKEECILYKAVYEEYGDWIYHRSLLFNNLCINEVYGTLNEYLIFRDNLFKSYSGLFNSGDDDDEDDEDEEDIIISDETPQEKKIREKEEKKTQRIKKWGWDSMLIKLSGGDILKINDVTKLPLIQAFNTLSIKKELDIE